MPSDHLGDRHRCLHPITRPGSGDNIAKSAYNKTLFSVAPAHHRWSTSNARWGSDSLIGTQSSRPPLFGYRKNAKKENGYWCSTGLYFVDQTFQKLRPPSATIQENGKFTFLFILECCCFLFCFVFCLFFAYFSSF